MHTVEFTDMELVALACFIAFVGEDDPEGYQFDGAAKQMLKVTPFRPERLCVTDVMGAIGKLMSAAADAAQVSPEIKMELAAANAVTDQLREEVKRAGS